jgi:hypothetical protein
MLQFLLVLFLVSPVFGLEVIKHEFKEKIQLRIERAEPGSFESYGLINHNGQEMTLVCANNRVYDNNSKAIIKYKNFYGQEVGDFQIKSNQACLEMGKFIEAASFGIDENRPFLITLNTKNLLVEKIIYPNIDPYLDKGDINDLYPKKRIFINTKANLNKTKKQILH